MSRTELHWDRGLLNLALCLPTAEIFWNLGGRLCFHVLCVQRLSVKGRSAFAHADTEGNLHLLNLSLQILMLIVM